MFGIIALLAGYFVVADSTDAPIDTIAVPGATAGPVTSVVQYTDRFGRSLPMKDVTEILSASVRQVLQDATGGVPDPNNQRCVAINPEWLSSYPGGPLPQALLDGLVSSLERDLSMPVYESDFDNAADGCSRSFAQHISFETFSLGGMTQGKLTVELREWFAGTWGGSDWIYTFVQKEDQWSLSEIRSTGAS